MSRYFHFTLGPVQGFVAQARRTRDFWAGSFLLSWLAAVAIRATQAQSGKILFPVPDTATLNNLEGKAVDEPLTQGKIPNRFLAEVDDSFEPEMVVNSLRLAWRSLGEAVWKRDLADIASEETRKIWDRQIAGLWEISWAFSTTRTDSSVLDRRKNLRVHHPPTEPGVKCTLMESWQELSGAQRPSAASLKNFWSSLLERKDFGRDLATDEHLCAIAFIKRRFTRVFDSLKVAMPGDWALHGWALPAQRPSVVSLAAAPWWASVLETATTEQLHRVFDAARALGLAYAEKGSEVPCIERALQQRGEGLDKRLASIDGEAFFPHRLRESDSFRSQPDEVAELQSALTHLDRPVDSTPPSPYYAVLLMDGDQLGVHMSTPDKQEKISKALDRFTSQVPGCVNDYSGFLVYTGGDDVLALLPMEYALPCAASLRRHYLRAFEGSNINTTLSGAVQFAHMKVPLTRILGDTHTLLDIVAKEKRGRDAVAVRVWNGGGCLLEWAMPWELALKDGDLVLDELAAGFRNDSGQEADFSGKFFYRIRERIQLLNGQRHSRRRAHTSDKLKLAQAVDLLAADYLSSGVNRERPQHQRLDLPGARAQIEPLLDQCRPALRDINEKDPARWWLDEALDADGAVLVRFLARKGIDI